jgi:hypothetical protein
MSEANLLSVKGYAAGRPARNRVLKQVSLNRQPDAVELFLLQGMEIHNLPVEFIVDTLTV